jgi:hypothetical protein
MASMVACGYDNATALGRVAGSTDRWGFLVGDAVVAAVSRVGRGPR